MDTNRTNSSTTVRALAAVMLVALFGTGYAISERGTAPAEPTMMTEQAPFEYFPAQYVNQGKNYEQHIQAF